MNIIIVRKRESYQQSKTSQQKNNFNEKNTTTNQHFIIKKETNTNTNILLENRSPNNRNHLISTKSHRNNPNGTTTVIKINVPRRAIGRVVGKKGKEINYLQKQNKMKIATTFQKTGYQDFTIPCN